MYRQQILDHYKNPRNHGELEDPTFSHTGENPMCGDEIRLDIKLDSEGETIDSVAFDGDGCAISIAATSMLTTELEGMPVEQLVSMDRDDMLELLGVDISPMRVKCAVLGEKVAQDGYEFYAEKQHDTADPTQTE